MHRIHSFTLAAALAAAFTGASAATAQTQPPQQPAAAQKPGAVSSHDTQFVQKAAASGQMEVDHGKLAAQKATNGEVKTFANTLVKDHTASNQELTSIAKRKNIVLTAPARPVTNQASPAGGSATSATSDTKAGATRTPTSGTTGTTGASGGVATTGEARDRQAGTTGQVAPWMSATGAAFDRGFIDAQVKAHQEAIALFEKQAKDGDDNDLQAFAEKHLPGLRSHLKQAQELQSKPGTN